MIFVTVGTHEQPFDRLVQFIDEMKGNGKITEEVVIQTGFSTYEPKYCTWKKLIPHMEMRKYIKDARIVITHGGPASFLDVLHAGKKPIVVPRRKVYNEHVNDHQVDFCRQVVQRHGMIFLAEDMEQLQDMIIRYDNTADDSQQMQYSNCAKFVTEFEKIVDEMFR